VAASLLLSHGWQEGSQVLYRRTDNVRVQVGELADLFRGPAGGHWWFEASVAAVPTGYRTIGLPRVGEESVSVQSAAWTGVIFRRGASVVDVYVSSSAPEPPLSVLAIARLLDRRMEANPSTARLETQSRTPRPLAVHTWLRPKPLSDDGLHTLFARTSPGALCTARVVYMPNRLSKTFHGTPRRAGRDGRVQWSWREEIAAAYGSAFVTCSVGGRSTTGQMRFQVVP
jgi:hypothetical protein